MTTKPFARHRRDGKVWLVQVRTETKKGWEYVTVEYMTSAPPRYARLSAKALADRLNAAFEWHVKGGSISGT